MTALRGMPYRIIALLTVINLAACTAKPSPYGVMQVEYVKLDAATLPLKYLEEHRADAPNTYEDAQFRRRETLARADVQEAIQKVGRVESYHLEAQLQ
jgi:hypothetical protein